MIEYRELLALRTMNFINQSKSLGRLLRCEVRSLPLEVRHSLLPLGIVTRRAFHAILPHQCWYDTALNIGDKSMEKFPIASYSLTRWEIVESD